MSRATILREQHEAEARVVNEADRARRASIAGERDEISTAYDRAQRALAATQPPADEHGVAFAVGQEVKSLTELWYSGATGQRMLVAGARGVLAQLDAHKAAVLFEGLSAPYLIRLDRLRVVLEVLK